MTGTGIRSATGSIRSRNRAPAAHRGVVCLLGLLLSLPAAAEEPAAGERPPRWNLHAGGFAALTGPAGSGPVAAVEVLPGGALERYGLGVRWRGFDGVSAGWVQAGGVFEAAAARPRLVISLHGEAGLTYPDHCAVFGGGTTARLWIAGPLHLAAGSSAHLVVDGLDSQLALGFTLALGLGG